MILFLSNLFNPCANISLKACALSFVYLPPDGNVKTRFIKAAVPVTAVVEAVDLIEVDLVVVDLVEVDIATCQTCNQIGIIAVVVKAVVVVALSTLLTLEKTFTFPSFK